MDAYSVLLIEDEQEIRSLLIEVFQKIFGDRLRVTVAASVSEAISKLSSASRPFRLVIADFQLCDETAPISRIVNHLRQQVRAAFILMSGRDLDMSIQGIPSNILFRFLGKPFSIPELCAQVEAMIAFIEDNGSADILTDSPQIGDLRPVPVDESIFEMASIDSYSNLEDLMGALPTDPSRIVVDHEPRILQCLLQLLHDALKSLEGATERFDRDEFSALCRRLFPLRKRESLLRLLENFPEAAFVLDIAWHDVNNALTLEQLGTSSGEAFRARIDTILVTALKAFSAYLETGDRTRFLERDEFDLMAMTQGYMETSLSHPDASWVLELPAGGLRSVWDTFVSNALKLKETELYRLGLYLVQKFTPEGQPYLEVWVYDDLPAFAPDQLAHLFDRRIRSHPPIGGMGTGLARLAQIVKASWAGRAIPEFPIGLFQRTEGGCLMKLLGEGPVPSALDLSQVVSDFDVEGFEALTKVFVFRLPLVHASTEAIPPR